MLPASPSRMLLVALLCAGPALAQGSDACSGAQPLSGNGNFNFVLLGATTDGLPSATCNFFGQDQIASDVWFLWTATQTGSVTVQTCGVTSGVDTKIAAYPGLEVCPPSTVLACNDDVCGLQSSITFPIVAGGTYRLRVGTYPGAAQGTGQINVQQSGGSTGNDACATPTVIAGPGLFSFDLNNATTDGPPSAACDFFGQQQIERDVWFAWTATSTEVVTMRTCSLTTIDTKMAVYSGTSCPPAAPLACNDDACSLQSSLAFSAVSGNVYLVRVGVYPGATPGTGQLEVLTGVGGDECNPLASGPDVIVGDLNGITRWGTVGGITGYSIGTDSCNVGDQNLAWFASTNQHPVIAQNLFRLHEGRFEQLGQSWLKHGFAALNLNLCCSCNNPGSGSLLGVGCSDPYDSSLNGSQGGLGPRWEVDAHTGAFPYPFATSGQTGNAIYKRLQVVQNDLSPALFPGAQFFAEGHYVTPDDAAAGNQLNNASYRPVAVGALGGDGYALSFNGPTVRRKAAIYAWQAADPGVQLSEVDVPGAGRVVVGARVTQVNASTWRYEYAVYNMTLTRGVGAFRLPVGAGTVPSAIGFRGVPGHSGDPYSSAAWTSQLGGGELAWRTQTFSQNPFANPIRWGTLYNFRFEADAAPTTANATLELFAPGTPGSVSVALPAPSGSGNCGWVTYCVTAPNSQGAGATVTALGSTSIAANDFVLHAAAAVPNQFGLFYYGASQIQAPFGDGVRCVGAGGIGIFRLSPAQLGNFVGEITRPVNFGAPPTNAGPGAIQPGSTWNFQLWYRDPAGPGGSGFNLSNGLSATFCP